MVHTANPCCCRWTAFAAVYVCVHWRAVEDNLFFTFFFILVVAGFLMNCLSELSVCKNEGFNWKVVWFCEMVINIYLFFAVQNSGSFKRNQNLRGQNGSGNKVRYFFLAYLWHWLHKYVSVIVFLLNVHRSSLCRVPQLHCYWGM